MQEKNSYHTKQKQSVLDFFALHPHKQFSAKEIAEQVKEQSKIGESTVYRLIKKLTESGEIRRFSGKNVKSVVYQYAGNHEHCHEHFHLKCTECGEFIHLDCKLMKTFGDHCSAHHGFTIDPLKTVFYGVCEACNSEAKGGKHI